MPGIYTKIKLGRLKDARSHLESVPIELMMPDERLGIRCLLDISEGKSASSKLEELIQSSEDPMAHHAHSYLFLSYAILQKETEAFEVLEKIFKYQSSILLLTFRDPLGENIWRSDVYQEYHQKLYAQKETEAIPRKSKSKTPDDATVQSQLARLTEYMDTEEPFLNPALTLRLLADHIAIHPNQLSWLLNEHLGKNFNEFINQKRIAHFKKLVVDPSNAHISILGLAYESGFNSKTVFNTAFKKEVGMTPKQYQKSQS